MMMDFEMTCTVPCSRCGAEAVFSTKNEPIYMKYVEADLRNLGWSVGVKTLCLKCQGVTRPTKLPVVIKYPVSDEDPETAEAPAEEILTEPKQEVLTLE